MAKQTAIIIRELGPDDTEAFCKLRLHGLITHPISFWETAREFEAKPVEQQRARMEENARAEDKFILGAFDGDELVGVVGCSRESGERGYHRGSIWGMYVHVDRQGRGIGGRLLDAAIEQAKRVAGMEVLFLFAAQTESAMRLYESRGFQTYGIEPYSMKVGDTYYSEAMMYLKL